MDLRTARDFTRLSGFSAEEIADAVVHEVGLYSAFSEFVKDGRYSKNEQEMARAFFGEDDAAKMLHFVRTSGSAALSDAASVRRLFALRCALPPKARERLRNFDASLREFLERENQS